MLLKRNKLWLFLLLCLFAYLLFSGKWVIFFVNRNPVIILTKDGFYPKSVVVKKGTNVVFVSRDFDYFWPASNLHPNHSIYPEFDSLKKISKEDSWAYTFDLPGIWEYHDHLRPEMVGEVRVLNDDYLLEGDSRCKDVSDADYVMKQKCWYTDVRIIADKSGTSESIDYVASIFNSDVDFQKNCHDLMHLIGSAAYRDYERGVQVSFDDRMTYCNYGFYHGFIESFYYVGGDFLALRDFCLDLKNTEKVQVASSMSVLACFHGIGHAAFDYHDGTQGDELLLLERSKSMCKNVSSDLDWMYFKQCMTGVYNALGVAYTNDQYGLVLHKDNPNWVCDLEDSLLSPFCYAEVLSASVYKKYGDDYTFSELMKEVEKVAAKNDAEMSMYSMMAGYTKDNLSKLSDEKLLDMCLSIPFRLQKSCVEGVVNGMSSWGEPGNEFVRVVSFCKLISATERDLKESCFFHAFGGFATMYSPEKVINICRDVDERYVKVCEKLI